MHHGTELTLGFAFLLGVVHALEPGHGKTAMLVYLAGGRRSLWHPLVLGLTTAATHSLSLFGIAFGVHLTHHCVTGDHSHEAGVSQFLQWTGALLVVAVGAWLLVQALRGRQIRCACGHHHTHAQDCGAGHHHHAGGVEPQLVPLGRTHPASGNRAPSECDGRGHGGSYRTTALLGVAVGLLPCPSALAAFFAGLSTGSHAAAYSVIGLFAAGTAFSLSLVGILLQQFGDRLGHHAGRLGRLPWPFLRAGLILAIGLTYTLRLMLSGAAPGA